MPSHSSRTLALAVGAAALLALPAAASAAPTRTKITTPAASPVVLAVSTAAGTTLAVAGTSNGGDDLLDLRCDANGSTLVRADVKPDANGNWSVTLTTAQLAKALNQTCYFRAVPAGKNPPSRVNFAGVVLMLDEQRTTTVGAGANPAGVADFRVGASQLLGRGLYSSIGSCGLSGASVLQASTFFRSTSAFACAGFLPINAGTRTGALVDGAQAYASSHVPLLFSGSAALPGFVPTTFATTIDPATGNLTLREVGTLMRCGPVPAQFPPTPASCTTLEPAGVRYDRTWAQDHDGRFTVVTDSWYSLDGKPHQVDLLYESRLAGPTPAVSFSWQPGASQLFSAGFVAQGPAKVPATIYAARAVGVADNDRRFARGALSFKEAPTQIRFRDPQSVWLGYARTVPAQGPLRLAFIYSRSSSQAELTTLALGAENALRPPPCVVPRVLRLSLAQARTALKKANCQLGTVVRGRSTGVPKWRIKWQRPKTGTVLANDAKIGVTLNVGKPAKR